MATEGMWLRVGGLPVPGFLPSAVGPGSGLIAALCGVSAELFCGRVRRDPKSFLVRL